MQSVQLWIKTELFSVSDEQNIVTAKDIFRKKPEVKSVQNKVNQIKQSAKIKSASSYQAPYFG